MRNSGIKNDSHRFMYIFIKETRIMQPKTYKRRGFLAMGEGGRKNRRSTRSEKSLHRRSEERKSILV